MSNTYKSNKRDYKQQIENLKNKNIDLYEEILKNNEEIFKNYEKIDRDNNNIIDKGNKIFEYNPLINGKINDIEIESVAVHGCKCLTLEKRISCDGKHKIYIYTKSKSKSTKRKLLNKHSEQMFTIEELIKLNYIEKLKITVDDDWTSELKKGCLLAQQYPEKIHVVGYYGD